MYHVYGLRLLWEDEYRYVGSTNNMDKRLASHFSDASREPDIRNKELRQWLNESGRERVVMDVLEEVDAGQDHRAVEQTWIAKLSADGNRLFNIRMADKSTDTFFELSDEERTAVVTRYLDDFERDTDMPWLKEDSPTYEV
jgi:hypothetical protein